MSYAEIKAPTKAQIDNHEKILLWDEGNIPYHIENEEKGLKPTIRAYLVEGSDSAVVVFPGGGYFILSDEGEGVDIAKAYNAEGISAFVVNYRYEPYDGRAILADGQRAVRYVRYFAQKGVFGNLDPHKIAVCGFSAGGHLAMLVSQHGAENITSDTVGSVSSTPDACVLVYAVTTLDHGAFSFMARIFLGDKQHDMDELKKLSYPYNLGSMPPTFICYSIKDEAVDCTQNAIAMYDDMKAVGLDAEIRGYTDATHGCGLGLTFPDFSRWHAASADFLHRRGF